MIDCSKCIHSEVCANRYANDGCEGSCGYYLQDIRPQGEWITKGYEPFGKCNICGGICEINNFCGHCGVKMKYNTEK